MADALTSTASALESPSLTPWRLIPGIFGFRILLDAIVLLLVLSASFISLASRLFLGAI